MKHRKESKPEKEVVILYHADCADGFSAAWAAWKKLKGTARYIAVPPNNKELPRVAKGKRVITLDYAFPEIVMPTILKQVTSLTVIDHHASNQKSAEQAHERLFDVTHSGSVLSWNYFHPGKKVPKLLLHVEDYDLWKFRLPHTREIAEAFSLYDMNFETWEKIARDFETKKIKTYVEAGKLLTRLMERRVGRLLGFGEKILFEGHKAMLVNSPFYVSEVGHAITKRGFPVALIWSRRGNKIVVSLRSDGSVDVAKLAERYGGGGHPAAAGFSFEKKSFLSFKKIVKKRKT